MDKAEEGRPLEVNNMEPDDSIHATEALGVMNHPVPDGGWGWLVVLGFCISHFIHCMSSGNYENGNTMIVGLIIISFGVTYLILLDKFHASATATIWVGAITVTCTLSIGPLASGLCRRFGCRCVSMTGAAMIVAGVIATGQAPNIYVIYVTYGLMTGIGLGFIYTPGYIIISQYFDKRKALALSTSAVANGASTLICPPLLLFLVQDYGFSGMFLIMGGICLHLFINAMLYRPLTPQVKTLEANTKKTNEMLCYTPWKKLSIKDKDDDANVKCLTARSEVHIKGIKQHDVNEKTTKERYLALFKNCAFIAFAVLCTSIMTTITMIQSLLPAMAVDNGIDETRAAFLLSIRGISAVIGSLALGHLFDIAAIRRYREHVYAGWCAVLGVGVLLMGVVSTYSVYIPLAVLTGTAIGLLLPQRITIVGDIVGKISDMEGFGMVTFMSAFGGLIGQAIAGPIKDYSGRYNLAYLLAGGFTLTAALVFEAAVIRHERAQKAQQQTLRSMIHET